MESGLDTSTAAYQQEDHLMQCQAAIAAAETWLTRRPAGFTEEKAEIDVGGADVTVATTVRTAGRRVLDSGSTTNTASSTASREPGRAAGSPSPAYQHSRRVGA
ncbi:hypothetical protein ABIB25_002319 [Nakamurella sp. UYEF19]|uniref:hypothetical protein n=1 Tax=Nakamurella sp. UYEF19 TaxID=1756392 RepID=UPI003393351D